ncbi:hypothetical protein STENM223S_05721 [Streptomyces tendae]
MSLFDTRVPAVLLRTDRNPFHHGTLGAVRSLGRAGVDVHVVADCAGSPIRASRYLSGLHTPPPPGASPAEITVALRRVAARIARPAVLIPMDDACAVAVARARAELGPAYLLPDQPEGLAERVADKGELAAVCASLDVPHPETLVPQGPPRRSVRRGGLACRWWRSGAAPGWCRRAADCAAPCWCAPRVRPGSCTGGPRRRAAGCCSRRSWRRAPTGTGSSTDTPTVRARCGRAARAARRGPGRAAPV